MANVNVSWVLPNTRESTKPLNIADIAFVEIYISADGTNFSLFDKYPPSIIETVVTELEPGVWTFKGVVIDTKGRVSKPLSNSITIEDNTPPSALKSLVLG